MIHIILRKLRYYRYAGFDKNAFEDNYSEINQINQEIVGRTSKAGAVIIGLLFLMSLFVPLFEPLRLTYLISLSFLVITILVNRYYVMKKNKQSLPILYLMLTIVDMFASVLGTINNEEDYATTICVFLVVLPIFIVDKPIRIDLINTLQWIVFCIMTYCMKDKPVAFNDIINSFIFLLCSFFISYQNVHIKLENLITKSKLKTQRDSDYLTKLNNRRALEKIVNKTLEEELESSAMLLLDIDNFKHVNDTFGHDKGDEVLVTIAQKLKSIFTENAMVSRIGGDEFVVFLSDYEGMSGLMKLLTKTIEKLKFELSTDKGKCEISASIGASLVTNKNINFEMLYKQADLAMYQVKRNGKNGYAIYQLM